jgi:hypothetical protein
LRRRLFILFTLMGSFVPFVNGTSAVSATASEATDRSGYWMLGSDGAVFAFGGAQHHGDQAGVLRANPSFRGSPDRRHESVDLEPSPSGDGYWILSNAGSIDAFGDARGRVFIDRPPVLGPAEDATGIAATPAGDGLWLFTSKGRVLSYGAAGHFGDMAGTALNGPVLDAIATPSGKGYYMVGSDGGIVTFGDALFRGSMGSTALNAPVQSLVPNGNADGYWLVASDGGIFAFGNAPFRGSMGGRPLNKPVTGMVPFGIGYLMVGQDGGIFNFSDQSFSGSLGDRPPARPIVSVAAFENHGLQSSSTPSFPDAGEAGSSLTTTTHTSPPTTTTVPVTTTTTAPAGPWEHTGAPSDLPEVEPTEVLACDDGTGKSAVVWYDHEGPGPWAAYNGCQDQWIVMSFPGDSVSDPYGDMLSVAPGAYFPDDPTYLRFSADSEGAESFSLESAPYDGTHGCPVGYSLWKLADGAFERILSCPDADDMGWYDEDDDEPYDGPRCLGREPDVIGTDADETFAAPRVSRPWVILAGGGDDVFRQDMYSGSVPVYFCGGNGKDKVEGYVAGFDGGNSEDAARVYNCTVTGVKPQIANVEDVTWVPCPDPS